VNIFSTKIITIRPFEDLPTIIAVASEMQTDGLYHHIGKYRTSEEHCIFKYTISGEGIYKYKDEKFKIDSGKGFLCKISDINNEYYYPKYAKAPWLFIYIAFKGNNVVKIIDEMINRYGHVYCLNKEHEQIVKMMNWRHFNGLEPHITAGESADSVFSLFTALINSKDSQREYGKNQVLSKAIDLINEKSNMNINASYIADELGISREHLSRIFQEEIGQAPYQYILRKKILLSCQLLKETDLSIKQICNRIGEESQVVFSRRFKTNMKMTPLEFRKYGIMPIK